MRIRTLAVIAASGAALTACTSGPTTYVAAPVAAPQVTQWCGTLDTNGEIILADDRLCEERPGPYFPYFGGNTIIHGGRTYVVHGTRSRPVNVVIKVRPVGQGGDHRTVDRYIRNNAALRNKGIVSLGDTGKVQTGGGARPIVKSGSSSVKSGSGTVSRPATSRRK